TSSSKPSPPSVVAGHAATETYSADAVLEVHPSWPLLGREPDPATPHEPHPAPTPALALLPDNPVPASMHPADPFSRDPRPSPVLKWAPPLHTWPPSWSVASTARSLLDPPHNKTATAPQVPVSLPVSESTLRDSVLSPAPLPPRLAPLLRLQSSRHGHPNRDDCSRSSGARRGGKGAGDNTDRESTRLNSSPGSI